MENNSAVSEFDADASLARINGNSMGAVIMFYGNIFVLVFMVIGCFIYYSISVPVLQQVNIILSPSYYNIAKPQAILFFAEVSNKTNFLVQNKDTRQIHIRNTAGDIVSLVKIDSVVNVQTTGLIGLYVSPMMSNDSLFSKRVTQHLEYSLSFETKRISLIERLVVSQ